MNYQVIVKSKSNVLIIKFREIEFYYQKFCLVLLNALKNTCLVDITKSFFSVFEVLAVIGTITLFYKNGFV